MGINVLYVSWIVYSKVLVVPYFKGRNAAFLSTAGFIVAGKVLSPETPIFLGLSVLILILGFWIMVRSLRAVTDLSLESIYEFAGGRV